MITLSWPASQPSIYSHVLLVDQIPEMIPFEAVQAPLCNTTLTYSLTDVTGTSAPPWISGASGTGLELSPSSLSLVGSHEFQLIAVAPISGVVSPATSIEIDLKHPCETTAISAADIPD